MPPKCKPVTPDNSDYWEACRNPVRTVEVGWLNADDARAHRARLIGSIVAGVAAALITGAAILRLVAP